MTGNDVFDILSSKGIHRIHHSNSVITSANFIRLGGLASRGLVEKLGRPQTPQYTDWKDKLFGIWNDVFFDTVDIHKRVSDVNKYGPVLFVVDARILLDLADGSEVYVTRSNPSGWARNISDGEKFFQSTEDLKANLTEGTFGQMIIVRTPSGMVPFSDHLYEIIFDNPGNQDVLNRALESMGGGDLMRKVKVRQCATWCKCKDTYGRNSQARSLFNV